MEAVEAVEVVEAVEAVGVTQVVVATLVGASVAMEVVMAVAIEAAKRVA